MTDPLKFTERGQMQNTVLFLPYSFPRLGKALTKGKGKNIYTIP